VEVASSRLAGTSVSTGSHTVAGSCGHNVAGTMIEAAFGLRSAAAGESRDAWKSSRMHYSIVFHGI
jgi:hypothetical protein